MRSVLAVLSLAAFAATAPQYTVVSQIPQFHVAADPLITHHVVAAHPVIETHHVIAAQPIIAAQHIIATPHVYAAQPIIAAPIRPATPIIIKPQPQIRIASAQDSSATAQILRYDSDNIGVDGYSYAVETSDGQTKEEQGQIVNPGQENESMSVSGRYSYPGPDGVLYEVTYTADDTGFHPEGAHIPKPEKS